MSDDIYSDQVPDHPCQRWIRSRNSETTKAHYFTGEESSGWAVNFLRWWRVGPVVATPEAQERSQWLIENLQRVQIGTTVSGQFVFSLGEETVPGRGDTIAQAIDAFRGRVPATPTATPKDEFQAHMDRAATQVSTWPEWKQGVLEHSSSPTVSVPRAPVVS